MNRSGVVLALGALVLLAACDSSAPTAAPSATPGLFADRPAVGISSTWTAQNGHWTFTGSVDPQGAPTDVILDVGPGPQTLRQFDTHLPVAQQVVDAQSLSITTDQIPDNPEICVRFAATNSAGTSFTQPLCFPHDLPTFSPPGAPLVRIDSVAPAANGQWTVLAYIDPKGATTDVVLDVGTGPATAPTYTAHVSMTKAMTEAASLQVSTEVPNAEQVCVRVTATNSNGTTSSAPTCFSPAAPS
ncbi:MAG: hypothetical protein HY263_03230 [Chloroflexi bacterium]|nr:hypothetical protein [Chloroflexota bacterium]